LDYCLGQYVDFFVYQSSSGSFPAQARKAQLQEQEDERTAKRRKKRMKKKAKKGQEVTGSGSEAVEDGSLD
jgi:Protein of unknown function (DUF1168)